jgi:hypothetical protein
MLAEQRKSLVGTVSRKLRSAIHAVRVERFYILCGPPSVVEPKIPCEIRCVTEFTPQIGLELSRIKGFEVNWKRRFDLSHRCYLTICDGQAVGYGWVSPGSWLLGIEQPLGPLAQDVAFIYDEITLERYRGKRLGPARLGFIANDMCRLGFSRSCQLIADDNLPSQRSALMAGYKRTESVVRLHRFALRFRFPEGAPPPELQTDSFSHYFAAATAHLVLGRA